MVFKNFFKKYILLLAIVGGNLFAMGSDGAGSSSTKASPSAECSKDDMSTDSLNWRIVTNDGCIFELTCEQYEKLKAVSNFFRSMFSENWKEWKEKKIILECVSASTFRDFMHIIDIDQLNTGTEFFLHKPLTELFAFVTFTDYIGYHRLDDQLFPIIVDGLVKKESLAKEPILLPESWLDRLKKDFTIQFNSLFDSLKIHEYHRDSVVQIFDFSGHPTSRSEDGILISLIGQTAAMSCYMPEQITCMIKQGNNLISADDHSRICEWQGHDHGLDFIDGHIAFPGTLTDQAINVCCMIPVPDKHLITNGGVDLCDGLVTGSKNGTVTVWANKKSADGHSREITPVHYLVGHTNQIRCMALTSDGKLITGSDDNTARVWDIRTGNRLHILSGHSSIIRCMALLSDGKLATGSDDGLVCIWNIKNGACLHKLSGHNGVIYCMETTPDGILITCSGDRTIRLWDIQTGRCLRKLTGHSGSIYCMALNPDKKLLATGSNDHTIRIWETKTWKHVCTFNEHANSVRCMVFTSNGKLLSGSDDCTVREWGGPWGRLESRLSELSSEQLLLVLKLAKKCLSEPQLDSGAQCYMNVDFETQKILKMLPKRYLSFCNPLCGLHTIGTDPSSYKPVPIARHQVTHI